MNDRKRAVRYGISFVILAVLLIFLFIWNVNSGSIHLSVKEILNIIFRHQGDETSYNIVWEIRLPRILAVIILGGALSVSGFLLQTFFNNPIAGPFVLGISSGAKLIVALLMIFFLSRSVSIGSGAMILAAFAGPISFVGIAVPHIAKSLLKTAKPLLVIPACFLGGAVFCLFCDLIARTVFAPTELSISSVTAVFGAPVVIYIMIRRQQRI